MQTKYCIPFAPLVSRAYGFKLNNKSFSCGINGPPVMGCFKWNRLSVVQSEYGCDKSWSRKDGLHTSGHS